STRSRFVPDRATCGFLATGLTAPMVTFGSPGRGCSLPNQACSGPPATGDLPRVAMSGTPATGDPMWASTAAFTTVSGTRGSVSWGATGAAEITTTTAP